MDDKNLQPGELLGVVDSLREQAVQAIQSAAERIELDRRIQENPMGTLAIAAGAGFLLGGGLWPVLRPVLKLTMRTLMSPQNLVAIAAAAGAIKATRGGEQGAGATPGQTAH